jgi:hypothetical protein
MVRRARIAILLTNGPMSQPRQLSAPAYLTALTLVLLPLVDGFLQVLPIRVHDPRWRFGTFGLMSNALMIPLLGLFVALAAAVAFDHRRFQRVLGVVAFVTALVVLVLLAVFGLDALQVRSQIKPPAQFAFNVAGIMATAKSLLAIVGLVAVGVAGFRGVKPSRETKVARSSELIMGVKAGGTVKNHRDTPSSTPTT